MNGRDNAVCKCTQRYLPRAYPPLGDTTILLLTQQFVKSNAIPILGCVTTGTW
jgi:hypothetical protein